MIQPLRGTKDILPDEISLWQYLYNIIYETLTNANYHEIRTPIIENTELFLRSIGNETDIINKEMYTFTDQGKRSITLRPEGTASIARAFIYNKLYAKSKVNKIWYLGPMFRYERPQQGRQRQFHQLGIEYIGTKNPIADVEVIRLATKILNKIEFKEYKLEINCIGNIEERERYKIKLLEYLNKYEKELDDESKKRLKNNTLRILDSKNKNIQEILLEAPNLKDDLNKESLEHFNTVCEHLKYLNIPYIINNKLIRGLDYYNNTAFEIKTNKLGSQDTICGGGRYDNLIEQLGGPQTPSVGWAIGIERLLLIAKNQLKIKEKQIKIYIAIEGKIAETRIWNIISILENKKINYELDITGSSLKKQIKRANLMSTNICIILNDQEVQNNYIIIKWLKIKEQNKINLNKFEEYINKNKNSIIT